MDGIKELNSSIEKKKIVFFNILPSKPLSDFIFMTKCFL